MRNQFMDVTRRQMFGNFNFFFSSNFYFKHESRVLLTSLKASESIKLKKHIKKKNVFNVRLGISYAKKIFERF